METIKRALTESEIEALNKKYHPLTPTQRIAELYNDFDAAEVMLTSSFAATSAYLLKLFSEINREQTVLFIDTGYHFRETLIYKDYLEQLYQLNVRSVRAEDWKHDFTNKDELRQALLELHYDLLDEGEAQQLRAAIESDPDVAGEWAATLRLAGKLTDAAKFEAGKLPASVLQQRADKALVLLSTAPASPPYGMTPSRPHRLADWSICLAAVRLAPKLLSTRTESTTARLP